MTTFPIPKTAGLFWIEREHWIDYVRLCADRDKLPPTYEVWTDLSERVVHRLTREGWEVIKIDVDLAQFSAWCRLNALDINRGARIKYADGIAASRLTNREQQKN